MYDDLPEIITFMELLTALEIQALLELGERSMKNAL
jgi:hypothetical protein